MSFIKQYSCSVEEQRGGCRMRTVIAGGQDESKGDRAGGIRATQKTRFKTRKIRRLFSSDVF